MTIHRINNQLFIDNQPLSAIAETYGTPCYVYSKQGIMNRWQAFNDAFGAQPHLVCYAVKTNSNIAILQTLASQGSGFDIVSGGELSRVLAAGANPDKIVFSGVGKSKDELSYALIAGIKCFNIESEAELYRLEKIATEVNKVAPISFRVNPDVDPKTHSYISTGLKENKFGVSFETALRLYQYAHKSPHLAVTGIDCHIGSQLLDLSPLQEAAAKVLAFQQQLSTIGIELHHIDMGGGLGIDYQNTDHAPTPQSYVKTLIESIQQPNIEILIEPGRSIVGNQGVLLTKVEYTKINEGKHFTIVDAAMNDLLRPSLYGAWQEITEISQPNPYNPIDTDVVGPVCETGDFLGKHRQIDAQEGDLLAILSAGAYGFAMSSNYNTRPRSAEILVDGDRTHLIRARETFEQLIAGEQLIDDV